MDKFRGCHVQSTRRLGCQQYLWFKGQFTCQQNFLQVPSGKSSCFHFRICRLDGETFNHLTGKGQDFVFPQNPKTTENRTSDPGQHH